MKKLLIILLFFSGCTLFNKYNTSFDALEVGSLSSTKVWIYLTGLLSDFIPSQMDELKVLDTVGKKLDIKFLVLIPQDRCANLGNKLCWPQNTREDILETFNKISNSLKNYKIKGYIGFSNGGFYLNNISQIVKLNKPIIAIGAAGHLFNKDLTNNIYLLIGKEDKFHYDCAIQFYKQSKNSKLNIKLIEYNEGHIIPHNILEKLLISLS